MTPPRADPAPRPDESCEVAAQRATLLHWYDEKHRTLPWRGETDPYHVLVSEVMLQQTRVATVERYYGPWLERFPDLATLASADEDDVLKAWEGLGYYRRARNLRRAAIVARDRGDGSLPTSAGGLRELPGVGEYTAAAVASIAFGEPVAAVDGNVRRVLARLFDVADPKPSWLRNTATRLLDRDRPGDWNQALMELGATVCAPVAPRCGECPAAPWCRAKASGTPEDRPARRERSAGRRAVLALAVLREGARVLLRRRPLGGLLGGMWAFPERELPAEAEGQAVGEVAGRAALAMAEELGVAPCGVPELLAPLEHRFTHIHAVYLPCVVPVAARGAGDENEAWVEPGAPSELALPTAQRRLLERLAEGADA